MLEKPMKVVDSSLLGFSWIDEKAFWVINSFPLNGTLLGCRALRRENPQGFGRVGFFFRKTEANSTIIHAEQSAQSFPQRCLNPPDFIRFGEGGNLLCIVEAGSKHD